MPLAGLEPAQLYNRAILSRLRLPFRHRGIEFILPEMSRYLNDAHIKREYFWDYSKRSLIANSQTKMQMPSGSRHPPFRTSAQASLRSMLSKSKENAKDISFIWKRGKLPADADQLSQKKTHLVSIYSCVIQEGQSILESDTN